MNHKTNNLIIKGIIYAFIANFIWSRLGLILDGLIENFKVVQTYGIRGIFPFGDWNLAIWFLIMMFGGIVSLIPAILLGGLLGFLISKDKIYPYRHLLSLVSGFVVMAIVYGFQIMSTARASGLILSEITTIVSYMVVFLFVGIALGKESKRVGGL
jgi:hypothetical protein